MSLDSCAATTIKWPCAIFWQHRMSAKSLFAVCINLLFVSLSLLVWLLPFCLNIYYKSYIYSVYGKFSWRYFFFKSFFPFNLFYFIFLIGFWYISIFQLSRHHQYFDMRFKQIFFKIIIPSQNLWKYNLHKLLECLGTDDYSSCLWLLLLLF